MSEARKAVLVGAVLTLLPVVVGLAWVGVRYAPKAVESGPSVVPMVTPETADQRHAREASAQKELAELAASADPRYPESVAKWLPLDGSDLPRIDVGHGRAAARVEQSGAWVWPGGDTSELRFVVVGRDGARMTIEDPRFALFRGMINTAGLSGTDATAWLREYTVAVRGAKHIYLAAYLPAPLRCDDAASRWLCGLTPLGG